MEDPPTPPPWHDNVMDGRGARPFRWQSVLVWFFAFCAVMDRIIFPNSNTIFVNTKASCESANHCCSRNFLARPLLEGTFTHCLAVAPTEIKQFSLIALLHSQRNAIGKRVKLSSYSISLLVIHSQPLVGSFSCAQMWKVWKLIGSKLSKHYLLWRWFRLHSVKVTRCAVLMTIEWLEPKLFAHNYPWSFGGEMFSFQVSSDCRKSWDSW